MSTQDNIQREILPIPDIPHVGLTTYDAKDSDTRYPPIEPLRPPKGAPNVLIVLLDDVGFGASSAFGGPCHMPTAERLAANGLRYNRFQQVVILGDLRPGTVWMAHWAVLSGDMPDLAVLESAMVPTRTVWRSLPAGHVPGPGTVPGLANRPAPGQERK